MKKYLLTFILLFAAFAMFAQDFKISYKPAIVTSKKYLGHYSSRYNKDAEDFIVFIRDHKNNSQQYFINYEMYLQLNVGDTIQEVRTENIVTEKVLYHISVTINKGNE